MNTRMSSAVATASETTSVQGNAMERRDRKVIHAAGVLVIQPNAETAELWQAELVDFGMTGTVTTTSLDEVVRILADKSFMGIVVSAASVSEAGRVMATLRSDGSLINDEDGVKVPLLLILAGASRANDVAARRLGYDAILSAPVHSRLIYRRMGSLMQKARRGAKRRQTDMQGGEFDIPIAAQKD